MNRRERHKRELQQQIIDATREIATNDGCQSITVRKIAQRIGYSPTTIYECFENKDALLFQLLNEGFQLLYSDVAKAITENQETPRRTLDAIAHAIWAYALRERDLFEIMYGLGEVSFSSRDAAHEPVRVFFLLREAISACRSMERGDLDDDADLFWSNLHGMVSLTIQDKIKGGHNRAETLIDRMVELHVKGWETL